MANVELLLFLIKFFILWGYIILFNFQIKINEQYNLSFSDIKIDILYQILSVPSICFFIKKY